MSPLFGKFLCGEILFTHERKMNLRNMVRYVGTAVRIYVEKTLFKSDRVKAEFGNLRLSLNNSRVQTLKPALRTTEIKALLPRFVSDQWLTIFTRSPLVNYMRNMTRTRYFGRGEGLLLAFVGVNVYGDGIITKPEEMEAICESIRAGFYRDKSENQKPVVQMKADLQLKDLDIGGYLANGCCAVVYAAKFKEGIANIMENSLAVEKPGEPMSHILTSSSIEILSHISGSGNTQIAAPTQQKVKSAVAIDGQFNLAVKVMRHYSPDTKAVLRTMARELAPCSDWSNLKKKINFDCKLINKLTPHPNIVDVIGAFVDYSPALPYRLSARGPEKTLYLIMNRFDCTLDSYLRWFTLSSKLSMLLFTQLLEAVVHLNRCKVAHRDLKSDNIMIDLSNGLSEPRLIITDFGCCLLESRTLMVPYNTEDVSKGGNELLMAPEISCAVPSPFSTLDYRKSDLWTAGCLAYDIFGSHNPFVTVRASNEGKRTVYTVFDTLTYSEEDLPPLDIFTFSDIKRNVMRQLISDILRRNPSERPNSFMCSNVCQLLLWAPENWFTDRKKPGYTEIVDWMLMKAAHNIVSFKSRNLDQLVQMIFLKRINLFGVVAAVDYMRKATVLNGTP